jgi:uncharacterized protein (DUF488 family)
MTANPTILTIGHGNAPLDEFVARLREHAVAVVLDVRSAPYSAHVPEYNREVLAAALPRDGVGYEFWGKELGGRPDDPALLDRAGNPDYEEMARRPELRGALARLIGRAAQEPVCLLCSEEDPVRCHRGRLLGRELAGRGCRVVHIRRDGSTETQGDVWYRLTKGQLALF